MFFLYNKELLTRQEQPLRDSGLVEISARKVATHATVKLNLLMNRKYYVLHKISVSQLYFL